MFSNIENKLNIIITKLPKQDSYNDLGQLVKIIETFGVQEESQKTE
jgi:hypothetical protein